VIQEAQFLTVTVSVSLDCISFTIPKGHQVSKDITPVYIQVDVFNFDLYLPEVGQIKNPYIMSCILIRCTYDKNLEMIRLLLQKYTSLLVFQDGHLAAIFEVRSGRNSIEM
jgi:hypothetical protein